MAREIKAKIIDNLWEIFTNVKEGILTDYRGLTAAEITELRRKLDAGGIHYRVVKNSLAQFAAKKANRDDVAGLFEGPVAIAFSEGEITEPAKVLVDYIRAAKSVMSIKGGFLESGLLTAADIETLAKLPSREVLLARTVGAMRSPITKLVICLSSPIRGIMGVLQARITQLEEA